MPTWGTARHLPVAGVLALLAGCTVPIAGGLDERDANLVADALNRAGIEATKEVDPSGEAAYRVMVPRGESATAIATLREHDLPPRHAPGVIDAVGKGALVPSPLAEHAQYVAGLSGDLERSLASIDGVLGARVHLSVPLENPLAPEPPKKPTASVLIRHRGATPPIARDDIQQLVAGAVADLAPQAVTVVMVSRPAGSALPTPAMSHVGPIAVAQPSAAWLRGLLGAVVVLLLGLTAAVLVLWLRMRRAVARQAVAGDAR